MQGVEGVYNLLAQGPDAPQIRSIFNALKPAVIDACNEALDDKIGQGFSRPAALTTTGTTTVSHGPGRDQTQRQASAES